MHIKTKVHIKTRQIKNKEVLNFRKKLLEKGNIITVLHLAHQQK